MFCTYGNVNVCVPYKPTIVTGLSKSLRNEKPVLHAAFRAFYVIHFIYKWKWGVGGGGLEYPVSLAEPTRECSSPVSA